MERVIYERMAEIDSRHWWFRARRQILRAAIHRIISRDVPMTILEIGCGTGHNLAMLSEFGEVEGVELDDEARQVAQRRTGRTIGAARLPELEGIQRGHYDLIALLDVLEHIDEAEASLKAVSQCLKPGGHLLVTVPAHEWLWTVHDDLHHHKRRYSRGGLRNSLANAGFEVKALTYFNVFLFPLILAARYAGRLLGKDSSDDSIPPSPINGVLERIFAAERHLVGRVALPTGVSLLAIATRN